MNNVKVVDDNERFRIASRLTWFTIILNGILAILKIGIGIISSSTAMIADGVHTVSDVGSSLGIIVGFIISKKPEDSKHQYGHEKAESIAGFVLSLMLIAVGVKIGYSSIEIMISGNTKVPGVLALWAAIVSIVVKEFQYRITMSQGKRINSSALMADAWHHRSDALSSIGTLVGIAGARLGYEIFDPLAGLIVSVIVVKVGVELFLKGYNELMDSSIEEDKLIQISNLILGETKIESICDIKARKHGSKIFVDVEVCVNPNISVLEGHDLAEDVEKVVYDNLDNVKKVLVHVNPYNEIEDI
ncbi:cation diffusion facilitator family transporter [Proteiniborus sp.]|uniref:cation diffusion facilitator family transporter n=1 Tax=Proteiniborus sp. TaxID=2079015 RepID=UPI00332D62AC